MTFETTNDGVNIYDPTSSSRYLRIDIEPGLTNLRSVEYSSVFQIEAKDSGGTNTRLFNGDPDGSVDLYYDGTKTVATYLGAGVSSGIQVFSADGTKSGAFFNNSATGLYIFSFLDAM